MFEGFPELLEQDIYALHAQLRAQAPADSTVEIDRRIRATGNLATAARKVVQLALTVREAVEAPKDNEDGMRERLDDPEAMERKHREIDQLLARTRQQLEPGGAAGLPGPRGAGGLSQELEDERQPRAA